MNPTIACGTYDVRHAGLARSTFTDVDLAAVVFDNVSLAGARFNNVNLGHASFSDINFRGTRLSECCLGDIQITSCETAGMTIDGIPVDEALALWRAAHGR